MPLNYNIVCVCVLYTVVADIGLIHIFSLGKWAERVEKETKRRKRPRIKTGSAHSETAAKGVSIHTLHLQRFCCSPLP